MEEIKKPQEQEDSQPEQENFDNSTDEQGTLTDEEIETVSGGVRRRTVRDGEEEEIQP